MRCSRCALLQVSDMTYSSVLNAVSLEERRLLGSKWTEQTVRVGNTGMTHRFINYLSKIGLLNDGRAESGIGWRALSFRDCVYVDLVHTLRKAGVGNATLEYLFGTFSQPLMEKDLTGNSVGWFMVLLCIHQGIEMEVIINIGEDRPYIADPNMMGQTGERATEGQIRVSMSTVVNRVLKRDGKPPVRITRSIGTSVFGEGAFLNPSEMDAVFSIRMLEDKEEEVRIRRVSDSKVVVDQKRTEDEKSELVKDLDALLKKHGIKDYSKLEAITRQGGVANTKLGTTRIYNR